MVMYLAHCWLLDEYEATMFDAIIPADTSLLYNSDEAIRLALSKRKTRMSCKNSNMHPVW